MTLHFEQPLIAWSVLNGHILRALERVPKKPTKWSKNTNMKYFCGTGWSYKLKFSPETHYVKDFLWE